MEKPGLSLFEGSEGLEIDPNLLNHEEKEDEEDQKRRYVELQNLLRHEFDNLEVDDDDDLSSLNSSVHSHGTHVNNEGIQNGAKSFIPMVSHEVATKDTGKIERQQYTHLGGAGDSPQLSQHYTHCFGKIPFEEKNGFFQKTDHSSKEQLEVLYEVRLREVQRLNEQLDQLKQQAAHEKDQLYRRLALSQAEKERSTLQLTHCKKQLETSKIRVSELEEELEATKLNLNNVKQANLKLTGELEAAQLSIKDLEKKVSMLERYSRNPGEGFIKLVQKKHDKEVNCPQDEVEAVATVFSGMDTEYNELHKRLKELSQEHEALIVEKTSTVNQLMANLEESQQQCQKLLKNKDNEKIVAEKDELENEVHKLKAELDAVREDLKNYESLARLGLLNSEDSNSFTMTQRVNPTKDLNIKLRDELQRCLSGLKIKRDEIKKLKSQIEDRDNLIKELRDQEAAYLAQVNNMQDAVKLMNRLSKYEASENELQNVEKLQLQLSELQSELDKAKTDNTRLQGELLSVNQQSIEEKLKAIDQHSEEYIQWHDKVLSRVRQEANQHLQKLHAEFSIRLEQKEKECTELKELYVEVCGSKEKLLQSLEQEQLRNREFTDQLDVESKKLRDAQEELHKLKMQMCEQTQNLYGNEDLKEALKEEENKVRTLELAVESAREHEMHCAETLAKAIEKAKLETRDEMELKYKQVVPNMSDVATSPLKNEIDKEDGMLTILTNLEAQHQEEMAKILAKLQAQHQEQIEQVKQESVQCLANELSACEIRHRQQLEQAEEEYSRNLASFRRLIDSKTQEVEVLKKVMLEERDKLRAEREHSQISEELKSRDNEIERLKQCVQLSERDFQAKLNTQSNEWRNRLAAYEQQVEDERNNMTEAIAGWAKELQTVQKQYEDSEIKIAELNKKYQAAKKTAYRYKEWADGKEKHVEQEWHRIALAFQNALETFHAKAEAEGDNAIAKQVESELKELQNKITLQLPR